MEGRKRPERPRDREGAMDDNTTRETAPITTADVPSAAPDAAHALPVAVPEERGPRAGGSTLAVAAAVALLVGLCAGTGAGIGGAWLLLNGRAALPSKVEVVPASTDEPVTAAVVAAVGSIVNIDISGDTSSTDDSDGALPQGHPDVPVIGQGSGVAFRQAPGGGTYILTNDHVVEGADEIVVRDTAGESYDAVLVGTDAETDIAVVEVDRKLPIVKVGDSEKLRVGDLVVAIGSPFGLSHSVTAGVVSALARSLPDFGDDDSASYPLVDVIQTDAAINPGNSGGALVDRTGRLVGINTALYSDEGANGGIGFAIPSNTAMRVAEQIISGKGVEHPFLGIVGQTVTREFADERSLPASEGAYVVQVTRGTGAAKAGVREKDLVVGLDSTRIRSMDDLILAVRRHRVGDTVTLKLYRSGRLIELEMTVGQKPDDLESLIGTEGTLPENHP
ncbi:MAG: peptidase S1 [Coriobacteriaceae bacterium]|nr:peptidase S1 [Coriobacteriaceae bacterium]